MPKWTCDSRLASFPKERAEELLRKGILRAMVSIQERNGWPQNVWSVFEGKAFESQLENQEKGVYHGYPMPKDDEFRELIIAEWAHREP